MCNVWSRWRTRVVSALRWIWIQCDYARLRVRGGVVSFASLRVVSSRSLVSLASLLCLHVRGRVIAGLRVFYVFAIFGIFGIFACLHVCMFAVR